MDGVEAKSQDSVPSEWVGRGQSNGALSAVDKLRREIFTAVWGTTDAETNVVPPQPPAPIPPSPDPSLHLASGGRFVLHPFFFFGGGGGLDWAQRDL